MNANKKNTLITLLLFVGLIICSQFGYAKDQVMVLDVLNKVKNPDNTPVEMVSMRLEKLESGKYKLTLLLRDPQSHPTLNKGKSRIILGSQGEEYIVTLFDVHGIEHRFIIDDRQIHYPDQCPMGDLSQEGCLVELMGHVADDDGTVEFIYYTVEVPYRDGNGNMPLNTKTPSFKQYMPDMLVNHSLAISSPSEGTYNVKIKNISKDDITVKFISLTLNCVNIVSQEIKDEKLSPNDEGEFEFNLSGKVLQNKDCDEYATIFYKIDGSDSLRQAMVPIKIVRDNSLMSWNTVRSYAVPFTIGVVGTVATGIAAIYLGPLVIVGVAAHPGAVISVLAQLGILTGVVKYSVSLANDPEIKMAQVQNKPT